MSDKRWAWGAAQAFVIATLAALIAIPLLVQRRVDEQRRRIEASEPARTLLMTLQFNLMRELSSLNDFVSSGDTSAVRTFRLARSTELETWAELRPLAVSLGPDVNDSFVRARTTAELWHRRLNEDQLFASPARGTRYPVEGDVRQRFRDVLASVAQLDSLILVETQRNRTRIASAEQTGFRLTAISGALALLAAVIVAALVIRMRRLAAETERERRQAADALEELARAVDARRRLLRGVTHDVKNPLGAARGYAELLGMGIKGPLNAEQQNLVDGVERSIDSALAIISDLLDLARADSAGIHVERTLIDLNQLVREVAADHQPAATTAGHVINAAGVDERPLEIYTDAARVRQVLGNLVSNAIKYTPAPGRIDISVSGNAVDAPIRSDAVAISVSDTGPGIAPEHREHIFDEFTRLDDHSALKGHGLGLSIARRIARLLGGDLGMVDQPGPGATFVLWLPQRSEPERRG